MSFERKTNKKKSKSILASIGSGIGNGLHAMAEAVREVEEQNKQARELEASERAVVENAIESYERNVGKPFVMKGAVNLMESSLAWDYDRKGHLFSCPERCMVMRHCASCGADTHSNFEVFCPRCR